MQRVPHVTFIKFCFCIFPQSKIRSREGSAVSLKFKHQAIFLQYMYLRLNKMN